MHIEELDDILAQEFQRRDHRTREFAPEDDEKLDFFTICCLILNRSIGSGIFVTPLHILLATNSVGITLLLWAFGAFVAVCGVTVWNEFAFTVPRRVVADGEERPVPRSGGEKNYLEYIMQKPRFLATCMFGIPFIILGNLSGNSVAFGTYILRAAGYDDPPRSWNVGVALAALTLACLIHTFSRRGGIKLSNAFAVFKVLLLLAIVVIGFATAGGARLGPGISHLSNIGPSQTFKDPARDLSNYTSSFFYVTYAFSGFLQPFYVISEAKHPRKIYPKATYTSVTILAVLFMLVNVAFIVATPLDRETLKNSPDMASLFLTSVFGPGVTQRAMSALIATSIFGNLLVMTFTAARVKQEIAKEGVLFFPPRLSIAVARAYATPDAWFRTRVWSRIKGFASSDGSVRETPQDQSPMTALLLHWFMSVLLVAVTASLTASTAYFVLVFVYSYVLLGIVGFCVSAGLVFLYCSPSANWPSQHGGQGFRPWGGPTCAIIYALVNLFLLITVFLPPAADSPFAYSSIQIQWHILPAVGLSSILWGFLWWCGLRLYGRLKGLELRVARVPYLERVDCGEESPESGEWVQRSEIVMHEWMSREYIKGLEEISNRREKSEESSDPAELAKVQGWAFFGGDASTAGEMRV